MAAATSAGPSGALRGYVADMGNFPIHEAATASVHRTRNEAGGVCVMFGHAARRS